MNVRLLTWLGICFLMGNAIGEPQRNSIGMPFIRIEPGEYVRGFQHENGRERQFDRSHPHSNRQNMRHEKPAHRVAITQAFDIGQTEVTVGQFRRFVEATQYITEAEQHKGAMGYFPEEKDYVDRFHSDASINWKTPGFPQSEEHPVVCVTWRDALAFCKWLTDQEGVAYQLPTEAEWEYACRAGSSTWYSWGLDPDLAYTHANVADGTLESVSPNTTRYQRAVRLETGEGDGIAFTAPVAQFKANAWGLHDMHGNVWEWCRDRWAGDVYEQVFDGIARPDRDQVLVKDPCFEDKTDQHAYGDWRVMRGGGWTCAPAAVRSSIRTFAEAGDATVYTGFRVVRQR